jgi:hypothetical protein
MIPRNYMKPYLWCSNTFFYIHPPNFIEKSIIHTSNNYSVGACHERPSYLKVDSWDPLRKSQIIAQQSKEAA